MRLKLCYQFGLAHKFRVRLSWRKRRLCVFDHPYQFR